jgi:hypothetical protein
VSVLNRQAGELLHRLSRQGNENAEDKRKPALTG